MYGHFFGQRRMTKKKTSLWNRSQVMVTHVCFGPLLRETGSKWPPFRDIQTPGFELRLPELPELALEPLAPLRLTEAGSSRFRGSRGRRFLLFLVVVDLFGVCFVGLCCLFLACLFCFFFLCVIFVSYLFLSGVSPVTFPSKPTGGKTRLGCFLIPC